jgi:hypothetical protein
MVKGSSGQKMIKGVLEYQKRRKKVRKNTRKFP